jgi:hypothetical protein
VSAHRAIAEAEKIPGERALGCVFLAAPWLIMQPGPGVGFFAGKAPKPWFARWISVLSHTFFGLGSYMGAVLTAAL